MNAVPGRRVSIEQDHASYVIITEVDRIWSPGVDDVLKRMWWMHVSADNERLIFEHAERNAFAEIPCRSLECAMCEYAVPFLLEMCRPVPCPILCVWKEQTIPDVVKMHIRDLVHPRDIRNEVYELEERTRVAHVVVIARWDRDVAELT